MIIRVERHDRNFTIIDNAAIRDPRLSMRARGILVTLLSLPPETPVNSKALETGREKRDAIQTAMRELAAAGYLRRVRHQDPTGRWRTENIISEAPEPDNPVSVQTNVFNGSGASTGTGSTEVGSSGSKIRTGDKEQKLGETPEGEHDPAAPVRPGWWEDQPIPGGWKPHTGRPWVVLPDQPGVWPSHRDLLAEALAHGLHVNLSDKWTKDARGRFNAALKQLREAEATPDQVRARCDRWRAQHPERSTWTPQAITGNWGLLGDRDSSVPREQQPCRWQRHEDDDERGPWCVVHRKWEVDHG